MNPIPIQGCTRTFTKPTHFDGECGELQVADVMDGQLPIMYSAWLPTPAEVTRILMGAPVILGIVGNVHPVVQMYAGEQTEGVVG